jgi:adhesin transport system membrane fusion protein
MLFLIWSATAQINRIVRADGRVVPYEMPQFVQHLEGGVVADIFVAEGDWIARGDPIANISDIDAEALVNERRLRISALSAEAFRLEAEVLQLSPDWSLIEGEHSSDFVRQQEELFEARARSLTLNLRSIDAQLNQKISEIREVTRRIDQLQIEVQIAEEQVSVIQRMVDNAAGSRLELLEAMSRVAQINTESTDLESRLPRLNYEVDELRLRMDEARASFIEDALSRLMDVRLELYQLHEEMVSAVDRLNRTVLVSPVDGIVNRVFAHTVGGVIRPGDPVVEITPDSHVLIVEGWIDPAERATVIQGLEAIVRISAYDFAVHGTLSGEVVEVSADTVERENQLRQYRVRIRIDDESYELFDQVITPGMIATADVVVGSRTVLQYLISPLIRGFAQALREQG